MQKLRDKNKTCRTCESSTWGGRSGPSRFRRHRRGCRAILRSAKGKAVAFAWDLHIPFSPSANGTGLDFLLLSVKCETKCLFLQKTHRGSSPPPNLAATSARNARRVIQLPDGRIATRPLCCFPPRALPTRTQTRIHLCRASHVNVQTTPTTCPTPPHPPPSTRTHTALE